MGPVADAQRPRQATGAIRPGYAANRELCSATVFDQPLP